jgi:hypothetical protein
MPISIRLLIFGRPDLPVSLKLRVRPRSRAGAGDAQRERLRRELGERLPPHLVRDVLADR